MERRIHFNAIFQESKYGWKMTRETYIPNITESSRRCFENDSEINQYVGDCLINYDLNIDFFNNLSRIGFDRELSKFLNKHKEFVELQDLNQTKGVSGYYIMVLDEYKQIYIGTGKDIYKRLRRHMSEGQEFCNLLWGCVDTSKLSINSFRLFDITRIYVYYTDDIFVYEDKYISEFNDKYVLNRTGGGIQGDDLLSILSTAKYRKLK